MYFSLFYIDMYYNMLTLLLLLFIVSFCQYCYSLRIMTNSVSWGCTPVCEMECMSVYRWINEYVTTYDV